MHIVLTSYCLRIITYKRISYVYVQIHTQTYRTNAVHFFGDYAYLFRFDKIPSYTA